MLSSKKYLSFLFVSLIVLQEATSLAGAVDPDTKDVTVTINNRLPTGADVTIHCKSGDDDLGTHVVTPFNNYEFSFNVNFFGTTLFFCHVSWRGGSAVFDVYKAKRDLNRCPHFCIWNVKKNGVEGLKQGPSSVPDIVIPWK